MPHITNTPTPPYYAAIFTTQRTGNDDGYATMSEKMNALAAQQPGYLGMETVRNGNEAITVSYWQTEDAIQNWKKNAEHLVAQKLGHDKWYAHYAVRIAKVERAYQR